MLLHDRLRAERAAHFVGRTAELEAFRARLTLALPGVLYVHGPGGVGKTTLLDAFARAASAAGVRVATVDLQETTASVEAVQRAFDAARPALAAPPAPRPSPVALPEAVAARSVPARIRTPHDAPPRAAVVWGDGALAEVVLRTAMNAPPPARAAAAASGQAAGVLLVDALDAVGSLADYVRDEVLPWLPGNVLVVLAAQTLPGGVWRSDPGWQAVLTEMPLGPLADDEARALVARRGVDPEACAGALAFARGHPLALALAAEAARRTSCDDAMPDAASDASPEIVHTLLGRFLSEAASPELREAVEAASLVRCANEAVLEAMLERPVPPVLFAELSGLPITSLAPDGLVLHELARDVIAADLRWRAPERYARYHARARHYYGACVREAASPEAQRAVLAHFAFLFRDSPLAGPLLAEVQRTFQRSDLHLRPYTPADRADVGALVARHEGPDAAAHVAAWLDAQPDATTVVRREADGALAGVLVRVRLDEAPLALRNRDPLARAAWDAVAHAAPRGDERALLFRSWMDRDAHQAPSPVQALLFAQTVWDYLSTPRLAMSMIACAAPHPWGPVMAFAGLAPWGEATCGDVRYDLFGHDWRAEPPEAWLARLAGQAPDAPPAAPAPAPEVIVLAEEAFARAVREALRCVASPHRLVGNPLLGARLVVAETGPEASDEQRTAVLARHLREAIERVAAGRRGEHYAGALRAAFVRPAPSHEIAAERLGVPYSTFRRHLARGIEQVVEALWAADTSASASRPSAPVPL